jgi:hypothetical protein
MKDYFKAALFAATIAVAFFAGTQVVQIQEKNTETVQNSDESDAQWESVYGSLPDACLIYGDAEVPQVKGACEMTKYKVRLYDGSKSKVLVYD